MKKRPIFKYSLFALVTLLLLLLTAWKISRSRTFQFFGDIHARVSVDKKVVALTLDDGPTPRYTKQVLDILHKHEVKATFFLTGRELAAYMPLGRMIVKRGHEIGNHSFYHKRMVLMSYSRMETELRSTNKLIREAGYQGGIHFRPPYFKKLFLLPYLLSLMKMKTITCDVEPESYREAMKSPKGIVDHVMKRVRPGSIILLHVMYSSGRKSRIALPTILQQLKRRGYTFVTVSRLLSYKKVDSQ